MLSTIHCSTGGDDSREDMLKFILINSRLERAHSSQCSAVQCSTIKNYKYANQQMIPFPIARNSSRAKQPLWVSRKNVTGLLHWLQDLFQIKIENICVFKLIKKNTETSLKNGFAQIFSCCPKNLSCPKFGGAAALYGWFSCNLGRHK